MIWAWICWGTLPRRIEIETSLLEGVGFLLVIADWHIEKAVCDSCHISSRFCIVDSMPRSIRDCDDVSCIWKFWWVNINAVTASADSGQTSNRVAIQPTIKSFKTFALIYTFLFSYLLHNAIDQFIASSQTQMMVVEYQVQACFVHISNHLVLMVVDMDLDASISLTISRFLWTISSLSVPFKICHLPHLQFSWIIDVFLCIK